MRLIAEIDETCDLTFDGTKHPPGAVGVLEVVDRSLDVALAPLSTEGSLVHDFVGMLVWITVGAANIRHVTYDPVLARRYAVESSPDTLRRPTSLHAIASAIGLPYATVWRKARALEAAGLLAKHEGGWIILTAHLRAGNVEASVRSTTNYILRKIRELVRLGLRADRLDGVWLNGRVGHATLSGRSVGNSATGLTCGS